MRGELGGRVAPPSTVSARGPQGRSCASAPRPAGRDGEGWGSPRPAEGRGLGELWQGKGLPQHPHTHPFSLPVLSRVERAIVPTIKAAMAAPEVTGSSSRSRLVAAQEASVGAVPNHWVFELITP